jgi:F-type H+-transporting ATPase subunit g
MFKQVFKAEKLQFPTDLNTWVHTYASIWARGTSGKWWTETVKTGAWAGVGIAVSCAIPRTWTRADLCQVIESYGIFKLGELLGRRNLVGYSVKDNHSA